MADLPILFSGSMVRALLHEIEKPGTGKTQTRRVLSNSKPNSLFNGTWSDSYVLDPGNQSWRENELRYSVGDRLWVRERARCLSVRDGEIKIRYEADGFEPDVWLPFPDRLRFRPEVGKCLSMGCYREASRLTLPGVTDVRVQRLQEISGVDCIAEGAPIDPDYRDTTADQSSAPMVKVNGWTWQTPRAWYHELWDSLNDSRGYGWDANPWVAAYTFRPVAGNIDEVPACP